MNAISLTLNDDVLALLYGLNRPVQQVILEMLVLELYRRGMISSGKAAQLLEMPRVEFIHYSSRLGISFIDMTDDEWKLERKISEIANRE